MSIPFIQRRGIGVVEIFGAIGRNVRVPLYNRILESLSQGHVPSSGVRVRHRVDVV